MQTFTQKQQALFERAAAANWPRLDTQAWLIPTSGPGHPVGPHSRSGGWAVRASVELATALAQTGDTATAWNVLDRVLDYQDTRPESFTYGNFFWYSAWDRVLDPNAVSFIAPHLAFLYKRFNGEMPTALRDRLAAALRLSVTGLNAHRATWGYTNIALLNIAAKAMIGDCLGDPRATQLAFWDWEEWRNHTAHLGMITEYNSVCYTFVQLHALAMMLACETNDAFRTEVRSVLRHLLSSVLVDFHPRVGRITGPQSRAYERDRRECRRSGMQTVLHLVWDEPLPDGPVPMWLGAPIGPDDVLFDRAALPLPRTTRAHTHGFTRLNHLADDFALGSVSGQARWIGHMVPFFLAYRSDTERCAIPVMPHQRPDGHFACQRDGTMLAACTWLFDRRADHAPVAMDWQGKLTGLNTGRPDNLVSDPQATAGFRLELGLPDQIRVVDGQGTPVTTFDGPLPTPALAVQTTSVHVYLRFAGAGEHEPTLVLSQLGDGEVVLDVDAGRCGRDVTDLETAVMGAFVLHVEPRGPDADLAAFAASWAPLAFRIVPDPAGWHVTVDGVADTAMQLAVPIEPPTLYSTGGHSVSANQWAASLSEGARAWETP